MIKKYLRIWFYMSLISFQISLISRFGAVVFTLGKLFRFLFFLLFLFLLSSKIKIVGGYSIWQMIFFFATFNLIDSLTQFALREVYRFRSYVVSGRLDYILVKPVSPLFRLLLGGSDILDIPMILLSIILLVFAAGKISAISVFGVILYTLLVANSFMIAVAFHVFVLGVAVLTTEIDNTIMLYRDIVQMGRIPIDVYKEPLRGLLTFAVPVGIMVTFPAKAIMGILSPLFIILSLLIGIVLMFLSLKFWRFSLRHYSSVGN